ncbi:hypothetical protein GQ56_0127775 [Burkholderia paludis]|nr:hypothetical protein GQ56_0127775 [Burkholderia paludis]
MTAAARRTDASRPQRGDPARRRRARIVALAVAASVSIHLSGWFVLQRALSAAGPKAGARPGIALRVELILARAALVANAPADGEAGPSEGARSTGRATQRSAAIATSRLALHASALSDTPRVLDPPRQRETPAGAVASGDENRVQTASDAEVDWQRDLDAIGARQAVARSPAQAAVGALGTSSGGLAPRRDTVDARLAGGMSDARRADCRQAHAGAGLLALPMLALDAVRDTGCRW